MSRHETQTHVGECSAQLVNERGRAREREEEEITIPESVCARAPEDEGQERAQTNLKRATQAARAVRGPGRVSKQIMSSHAMVVGRPVGNELALCVCVCVTKAAVC